MKRLTVLFLSFFITITLSATEKILGSSPSTGRWVKIAQIQNANPINGGECSQFSGVVNMQTDYGQSGSQQYYAIFSFGSRGSIKPLLQEFGDAANRSGNDLSRVEWRIYTDPYGWHYLWFWQSNYSSYAAFDYQKTCGTEYWSYENPPTNYNQIWSSLDGNRQLSNAAFNSMALQTLGIGTINLGTHKLAVEGSIGAREIKVEVGTWSDFVFYKDYKLPSLEEVAQHIKEKGHLKDIPSAAAVAENGIFLGEMNAKLLQKIEELTLYTLEQEEKIKEIEILKAQNILLEGRLRELELKK